MWGSVLQAVTRHAGTSTVGIEAIGQTVISVDSVRDFPEDAGFVYADGAVRAYNSVDRTNSTITLTSALTVALVAGADVKVYPLSIQRWLLVAPSDMDLPTDAVWCLLPHALAAFVAPDGTRADDARELVEYTRDGNILLVTDIKDKQPFLQSDAIPDGLITETKIAPESITTPLLAANAVATQHLQVGSVKFDNLDGDAINGKTITGALVRSAATGKRVELSTEGLVQIDDGENVTLSIGDVNKFTGEIDATSQIIQDSLQLFGRNNLFATGSKTTLKASTSAPTQAPVLSWDYEDGPSPSLQSGWFCTGVHSVGGVVHSTSELFWNSSRYRRSDGKWWEFPVVSAEDDRSNFKVWSMIRIAKGDTGAERVVMMGEDYLRKTNGWPEIWIRVYDDSTMLTDGSVAPVLKAEYKFSNFSWWKQYRLIRFVSGTSRRHEFGVVELDMNVENTSGTIKFHGYIFSNADNLISTTTLSDYGAVVGEGTKLAGGVFGLRSSLGLEGTGTDNILVINLGGSYNAVRNGTTATWEFNSYYPTIWATQDRAWWEGDVVAGTTTASYGYNFAASPESRSYKYASSHKQSASPPAIWANYSWRGEATTAYKTVPSPKASIAYRNKARLRVTMPALPAPIAGIGGARDPAKDVYGWIYYLGASATAPVNAAMYQQSNNPALSPGVPLAISTITLETYPALSGSNPALTTNFPASAPATIESDNGLLIIDGDGKITADELLGGALDKFLDLILPPGVVIESADDVAPYRTMLCNGAAVSRATYAALFAKIGITHGAGDGSTTFNIPNRQNKVGIGAGPKALGATGGLEDVTLTAAQSGLVGHNHTQNAHSHGGATTTESVFHQHNSNALAVHNFGSGGNLGTAGAYNQGAGLSASQNTLHTHIINNDTATNIAASAANASASHTNMQPYAVMNYYIRY